jgi:hypothetical protein
MELRLGVLVLEVAFADLIDFPVVGFDTAVVVADVGPY